MNTETRTRLALKLLGWQGGTVHQVCKEFGVPVQDFLYKDAEDCGADSPFALGWWAVRTGQWDKLRQKKIGNLQWFFGALAAKNLSELTEHQLT